MAQDPGDWEDIDEVDDWETITDWEDVPNEQSNKPYFSFLRKPDYDPNEFENVEVRPGQWISVRKGQDPKEVIERQGHRRDRQLWSIGEEGAVSSYFDRVRNNMANIIGQSRYIPERSKPGLAALSSLATEPFRLGAEILANPYPEDIIAPGIVKPSSLRRTFTPEVPASPSTRINLLDPKPIGSSPPVERIVEKTYPSMKAANPAEDTLLSYALRESPNPEQILYPRDNTPASGFDLYRLRDEAIQADVRRPEELARQRLARFTESTTQPQIPAEPFSERLGFNPLTREISSSTPASLDQPLQYPLNIVPHRVLPRSVQSQLEALVPERLKTPPHILQQEVPEITQVISPSNQLPLERSTGGILAEGGTATTTRRGYRGFNDRVASYVQRNVEPAIPGASEAIAPIIAQNKTWWQRFRDTALISGERQLEKLGPVGREIRHLLANVEYTKRELFNQFAHPYLEITNKLRPEEHLNFVMALDGSMEPLTDSVARAVAEVRKITDSMAAQAKAAGVRVKMPSGKTKEFEGLDKYWPHRPVNPIPHTTFVEEMMRTNPKLTRLEAEKLSRNFLNESEFFNSPQHQRIYGDYEWRTDLNAMIDHMADMADIIARAKRLGAGDIGTPGTIINKLIEQAPDKPKAFELVRTHLGGAMDKNNDWYQMVKRANEVATKVQVFTKLSLFWISNLNNQLQTILWGNIDDFAIGFTKALSGSRELRTIAREYGTVSVGEIPVGILNEAGRNPVPFVGNLVTWSDNFARSIATGTGQGTARQLFIAAKNGDKMANKRLQDLLLNEDLDTILKSQTQLTPEQLKFATHRFVERAQQLSSNMKLPPAWVNVPELGIPLIFKRFAFQGTKSIVDAMKMNPKRNVPLFLIAAPLFGELTGDLKSVVYGAVRGGPMPDEALEAIAFEIAGRHRFMENITRLDTDESDMNWLINRLAADYIQSWGLGLVADVMQGALGGKNAGYTALAGPAIDQFVSVVTGTFGGDFEGLGRESLRSVPVIGPGLQRRLLPTESQEMP